jgi:hypothetical protein
MYLDISWYINGEIGTSYNESFLHTPSYIKQYECYIWIAIALAPHNLNAFK